jgi:hypothetical protein
VEYLDVPSWDLNNYTSNIHTARAAVNTIEILRWMVEIELIFTGFHLARNDRMH